MDIAQLGIRVDSSQVRRASGDMEGFVRTGKRTEQAAHGVTASTASMGTAMARAARMVAVATGALAGIGAALRGAQQYTEITNAFRSMGQSGAQAAASLEAVAKVARGTRAPLEATAQLYQRISIAGKDLGASQSQVLRFTENVGLALAQTGTSASQASGALLQLSQAMAGGVVRAEEFNSILEGAYPIAQAAADGIDEAAGSVGKLRQMVVDGKVSSDEFFNAILSQTDALQAAFQNTTPTISQAFTILSDSMTLFVGGMDAAVGVSASIAKAILLAADNIDRLATYAGTAAVALGTYYAGAAAIAAARTVTLAGAMTTLRAAMVRTGILALVVGAGELVYQFGRLVRATGGWGNALSLLGDVASGVWEGIKGSALSIVPALGAVWADVQAGFVSVLEAMSLQWANFLWGLGARLDGVPLFGNIAQGLKNASDDAIDSMMGLNKEAASLEGRAIRLRKEAASMATDGFAKAREAAQALADAVAKSGAESDEAGDAAARLDKLLSEFSKGAGKAGKAAKDAAEKVKGFNETMKDAAFTAAEFGAEQANIMIGGIDSLTDAWGKFVVDGFSNFHDFTDAILGSFKGMLAQMIALAAKNRIMIGLGFGGVGGTVSAAGTLSGATGGAGGLGGLLGMGNLIGSGGMISGMWSGLSGIFSGGGLGVSFANLGGLVTGASSGFGALGAALPALGILAGGIAALAVGLKRTYDGRAVRGTLDPQGFDGYEFDFWRGGFLRGNKTEFHDTRTEIQTQLDETAKSIRENVIGMADILGMGSNAIEDFVGEQFTIWLTGPNAGSEAEIAAALEEELTKLGDGMAELIPGITDFSLAGEGAYDTLTRLGTGLAAVNDAADLLGHRVWQVSLASADAASELVEAFGGLEAMTASVGTFFTTMYSEQEQLETNTRRMRDTFADLGVVFPETREEYRQLVESIDTTSESGRQLYADLISLAGAMDTVLGPLFGFTPEIAGMINEATKLIDAQIQERQELARTMEQSSRLWLRTAETLRDFLVDLRTTSLGGLNPAQVLEATAMRYSDVFSAARGGDQAAAADYIGSAKAYLSAVDATATSAVDYRRAALQVERDAQLLAGISEFEGAKDQYIADLYTAQIDVLEEMKTLLQSGDMTAAALEDLNGTLGDLQAVIEQAEVLSYDYLRHNLDLVLDLIPTADIPPELAAIIEAAGGSLETLLDLIFRDENLTPGMRFLLAGEALNGLGILDLALTEPDTALADLLATGALEGAATLIAEIGAGTPDSLAALLADGVFTGEALLSGTIIGNDAAARLLKQIGEATTNWINVAGEFQFDPSQDLQGWFSGSLRDGVKAPISALGNMIGDLVGALRSYEAAIDAKAAAMAEEQARLDKIAKVQGRLDKFESNWGAKSTARVSGLKDQLESLVASTGVSLSGIKITSDGRLVYNSSGVSGTTAQLDAFRASGFWDDGGLQDQIAKANANVLNAGAYEDRLTDRLANLNVPGFASGGTHRGGLRIVGENGPELEATGPSRIYSARDTSSMLDNRAVVEELARLRAEVSALRSERRSDAKEAVKAGKSTARILRDWDINGQPLERT